MVVLINGGSASRLRDRRRRPAGPPPRRSSSAPVLRQGRGADGDADPRQRRHPADHGALLHARPAARSRRPASSPTSRCWRQRQEATASIPREREADLRRALRNEGGVQQPAGAAIPQAGTARRASPRRCNRLPPEGAAGLRPDQAGDRLPAAAGDASCCATWPRCRAPAAPRRGALTGDQGRPALPAEGDGAAAPVGPGPRRHCCWRRGLRDFWALVAGAARAAAPRALACAGAAAGRSPAAVAAAAAARRRRPPPTAATPRGSDAPSPPASRARAAADRRGRLARRRPAGRADPDGRAGAARSRPLWPRCRGSGRMAAPRSAPMAAPSTGRTRGRGSGW